VSVRSTSHPSIRKERKRNNPTDNNNSTTTTNNISYHIGGVFRFVSFFCSFHKIYHSSNRAYQKLYDIETEDRRHLSIYLFIYIRLRRRRTKETNDKEYFHSIQIPFNSIPYNSFVNTYNNNHQPPNTSCIHTYFPPPITITFTLLYK